MVIGSLMLEKLSVSPGFGENHCTIRVDYYSVLTEKLYSFEEQGSILEYLMYNAPAEQLLARVFENIASRLTLLESQDQSKKVADGLRRWVRV
jgi:hypothetical protein